MRREVKLSRRSRSRLGLAAALAALTIIGAEYPAARADQPVWACGHVLDAEGRPMIGAIVAAYDDANHVVDYAKTDSYGDYALAVPEHALHIEHRRGQGFLAEVFGGAVRFVDGGVGFMANPVRAGIHAVTVSEATAFADPLTRGGIIVGGAVVDEALFAVSPKPKDPLDRVERKKPGAMVIKVIAPDHNDLLSITHTYWVQDEVSRLGGKQKRTTAAWLDPIQLTAVGSDKPSKVEADYLHFTGARLTPSLAEPGQIVHIFARISTPPDPTVHMVVVARNDRTGEKWELKQTADGRFAGEFEVRRRTPRDNQAISILAYAALEQRPGRRADAEHAIEAAGLWNPKTPYVYDPLLVVSRNRADLTLTVISVAKK